MVLILVGSVFSLTLKRTRCSTIWDGVDDDILIWDLDDAEEGCLKEKKKGLICGCGTRKRS